jgi:hypothetical protein
MGKPYFSFPIVLILAIVKLLSRAMIGRLAVSQEDFMAVVRWGGHAPLPFIDYPRCFVCWYLTLEEWNGRFSIPREARTTNGVCPTHRARLGEGACLFCGRRLAWLRLASEPELAICRSCFVQRKGEAVADAVEAMQEGDGLRLIVE